MTPHQLHPLFVRLTPAQRRLMVFRHSDTAQSTKRTGEQLLALGLVEKRTGRIGGFKDGLGDMHVTWYEVPLDIHRAYCLWCNEIETAKAVA